MTLQNTLDFFLQHPFATLAPERIRNRAYFLSQESPARDHSANWIQAEREELSLIVRARFLFPTITGATKQDFTQLYETIFAWDESLPSRVLGNASDPTRRCNLCGRTKAEGAKFKKEAHVLPTLLGTRYLTTLDECDSCNELAGQRCEGDLGNMLLADRAMVGTCGKEGPVQAAFEKDGTRLGHKDGQVHAEVHEGGKNVQVVIRGKNPHVSIFRPRFRVGRVGAALAKITLQALPAEYRDELGYLRPYILGTDSPTKSRFYWVEVPGLKFVALSIWRRRDTAPTDVPAFVSMISTANSLLIWTPFDEATGEYKAPVLPPIIRDINGDLPTIRLLCANGDEYSPGAMRHFGLALSSPPVTHFRQPQDADVIWSEASGAGKLRCKISTHHPDVSAENSAFHYELSGGELIGILHLRGDSKSSTLQIEYSLEIAPDEETRIDPTRDLLQSIERGAGVRIALANDSSPILELEATQPFEDFDASRLGALLNFSVHLAVLRKRLGVELRCTSPDVDSVRTAELMAMGLLHGSVRVSGEASLKLPMTSVSPLVGKVGSVVLDDWKPSHGWICQGSKLEPGRIKLTLEKASIAAAAQDTDEDPEFDDELEPGAVVVCESMRFDFLDHLPATHG